MIKSLIKPFKIFLIIILACSALVGSLYTVRYFSYTHLVSVAKTLPDYHDSSLSTGVRSQRECYAPNGEINCKALNIQVNQIHDPKTETMKFMSDLRKEGVDWGEYDGDEDFISSNGFARDGRNYLIEILHESDDVTSVSLLEY